MRRQESVKEVKRCGGCLLSLGVEAFLFWTCWHKAVPKLKVEWKSWGINGWTLMDPVWCYFTITHVIVCQFHLVILQSSLYRITLSDVLDLHNIYIGGINFIVLNEHKYKRHVSTCVLSRWRKITRRCVRGRRRRGWCRARHLEEGRTLKLSVNGRRRVMKPPGNYWKSKTDSLRLRGM